MPRFSAGFISGSRIAVLLAIAGFMACTSGSGGGPGAGGSGTGGGSGPGTGGGVGSGGSGPASGGAGGTAAPDAPAAGATGGSAGGAPEATDAAPTDGPAAETNGGNPADSVVWMIDNTQSIGGHPTTVSGAPQVIDTPGGKAVQFNGTSDSLLVDYHPLAGLAQFTVEVIFRPDVGGAPEQRFFHMQANGSENRVLFETRLPGNGMWFLDTYVMSNAGGAPLFAEKFPHPIGPWYAAALIIDGTQMRHYINGVQELAVGLKFQPQLPGQTSFGVRLTKQYWYKGAILMARFTPRVLTPAEFLKATN